MTSYSQTDKDLVAIWFASPTDADIRKGHRLIQAHFARVQAITQNSQFRILFQNQICPPILTRLLQEIRTKPLLNLIDDLILSIQDAGASSEAVTCLLTFTIRVWLMCWIGSLPGEPSQGQTRVSWLGDRKMSETLVDHFNEQARARPRETVQLGPSLKACNLERFGGIHVIWTSNLPDHLRLQDPIEENEPYTLLVFHHAAMLEAHLNSDIFPLGLVKETMQTLGLLFPKYDIATIKWFRVQDRTVGNSLDPQVIGYAPIEASQRTTASFHFWAERLAILNSTYDAAEPRTLGQWWADRRNPVQWATFWTAALVLALTIFFGIVQSVEGALQVYKAYHPG